MFLSQSKIRSGKCMHMYIYAMYMHMYVHKHVQLFLAMYGNKSILPLLTVT